MTTPFVPRAPMDRTFLRLASETPTLRAALNGVLREAAKWKTLPKGWTQDSVKKFWGSLTGDAKHKVTKCIKQMEGKVDDTGAFCASLADVVDPGWRSRRAAGRIQVRKGIYRGKSGFTVSGTDARERKPNIFVQSQEVAEALRGLLTTPGYDEDALSKLILNDKGPDVQKKAEWKGWDEQMPVQVVTKGQHSEVFENLAAAKAKYPTLDPRKNTKDFTWATRGTIKGHPAIRFEDWETNKQMSMSASRIKQATIDPGYLSGWEKTVDALLRAFKTQAQSPAAMSIDKDPKPYITGFIYNLFQEFRDTSLAQALWNMFEHGGPSLEPMWGQKLAYSVAHRVGITPEGKVRAAAISLALLRRGRMPNLAARVETLFDKALAQEIAQAGPPVPAGKLKNKSQMFEDSITPKIKGAAEKAFRLIGGTPIAAETFGYLIADDANWHSLSALYADPATPIPEGLVTDVTSEFQWNIVPDIAAFIVTLLRVAGLKAKAEAVKKEALREFPDAYEDLGSWSRAANKENAMKTLAQRVAARWTSKLRTASPLQDLIDAYADANPGRSRPDYEAMEIRRLVYRSPVWMMLPQ